jgi:TonB family protein
MRTCIPIVAALCLASTSIAGSARQTPEPRVYTPGDGVLAPLLVKEVKPQYTPAALKARIQGVVTLECVVQPDGAIGEARVTKGVNPDLDQEAIKAVKQWRFQPGRKDGKAVPVRIALEVTFTLRDTAAPRDAPKQALFPIGPLTPGDAGGKGQPQATGVYKPGDGVSAPVVAKQVKPQYTAEAMRAKIEGSVGLECVVETDGRVGEVWVAKALDEGLDQEAIKAVRQWRFEPGKKDGKAVRVQITLEMTFTLK